MPARKLTDEQLVEFTRLKFEEKMFFPDIVAEFERKYGIRFTKKTQKSFINRAVKLGLIAEEAYENYKATTVRELNRKNWLRNAEKFGGPAEFGLVGWKAGVGSNQEKIKEAARLGGLTTQMLHPEVVENIGGRPPYRKNECCYGGIKFSSFGERIVALLLCEYGLIDMIVPGENFQKKFGKKKVDFFIKDRNIVVEYHPIPKKHSGIQTTVTDYKRKRKAELEDFFGEIIILTRIGDVHRKSPQIGIKKDWGTYREKFHKVADKIARYDTLGEVDGSIVVPF